MNIRFPLYAKILGWFFLNLLLLGVVFYGFLRVQLQLGLDSLLNGQAGERIQSVSTLIAGDLNSSPRAEWPDKLKRMSDAYKIQFLLFRNGDGAQIAGDTVDLPTEIRTKLNERRGPPRDFGRPPGEDFPRDGFRRDGPPPREGGGAGPREGASRTGGPPRDNASPDGPPPEGQGQGRMGGWRENGGRDGFAGVGGGPGTPFRTESGQEFRPNRIPAGTPQGINNKLMIHTYDPSQYWVLVRLPVFDHERQRPSSVTLVMLSDTLSGGGLFFDIVPWLLVGAGVVFFSVLFWLPLVRGITRSIRQITQVTEQVAEGCFDTRVDDGRKDELGRLGSAINRMASRLSGFVMGQKRFLGDIAHELCSPIARVQAALGILEQRSNESQKPYVEDVREEVQHMSSLVNELLSFSKAGLKAKEIKTVPVNIAAIAEGAVNREASDRGNVQIHVPGDLQALADPELLLRALSNLVRNAVRYAGDAGPITVSATAKGDLVTIMVADSGPGVPEPMLQQIFDPFFRLESSRSRDTGGIGLGLAIVKTCVESCQGSISVKNLSPSGLQVDISLKAVSDARSIAKPATTLSER